MASKWLAQYYPLFYYSNPLNHWIFSIKFKENKPHSLLILWLYYKDKNHKNIINIVRNKLNWE